MPTHGLFNTIHNVNISSISNANYLTGLEQKIKEFGVGWTVLALGTGLWIIKTLYGLYRLSKGVNHIQGTFTLIHGMVIPRLLPVVRGFNRSFDWPWKLKYSEYKTRGMDILAFKALIPFPFLMLQIADADAVREITSNRIAFPKPILAYKMMFELFGQNILSTEGEEWKRHRKVVAKAFTEPNNKMVWQNTADIIFELFRSWEMDGNVDEVIVENAGELTKDLALMVISSAGKSTSINLWY
jgi:hypothetical protein